MILSKIVKTCVLSLFIAGCTTTTEYTRPEMPIKDSWNLSAYNTNNQKENVQDIAWKDYFKSESLKILIEKTIENNRDIRVAVLNIQLAKAAYNIQKTDTLPSVNASSSANRVSIPENASSSGVSVTSSSFSVSAGITSYELDFFGKVKNLNQNALETYLATEEAQTSKRIALIAETASAYLNYLANKKQLGLLQETLKSYETSYELTKKKYELGTDTKISVEQAAASVHNIKALISQYTRLINQDKTAIELLAGTEVSSIIDNKDTLDSIQFMSELPVGLPSEVLLSRPDIMQAEHVLKAAYANIDAARASFYPTISLTGSIGLASSSLTNLFSSGSAFAWNFGPSINIPIFDRSKLKANLEIAKVNEKILTAQYEKAIQTAFKEVADSLSARAEFVNQLNSIQNMVVSNNNAYNLAMIRYKSGISGYATVLDTQRTLLSSKQQEATVRQQYLNNLITLYKVLGGGKI